MNKGWKRITAIFCTICIAGTTLGISVPNNEVKASGSNNTTVTSEVKQAVNETAIPENYKWITASDFHNANGASMEGTLSIEDDYINRVNFHDVSKTWDKTVFTAKIDFSASGNSYIGFGGEYLGVYLKAEGEALVLRRCGTHEALATFDKDTAGCQLVDNSDLKVTISWAFVNPNETSGTTDLTMGVFFNGKLYNNEYIQASGFQIADLKQITHVFVRDSDITIADVETPVPTYLFDYTTTTVGLVQGTKSHTNAIGRDNVDGTIFGIKVKFTATGQNLKCGGTNDWYGVNIRLNENNTNQLVFQHSTGGELKDASGEFIFKYIDPKTALGEDYTTFNGTEFDFHISTEIVNHDNDSTLDVRYGLYFNGKLYENTYIYSYDTAGMVGNWVGFRSEHQAGSFKHTGSISGESVRTDLVQLSTNDISLTNLNYGDYLVLEPRARQGKYEAAANFDGTIFGANITLDTNGARLYYGRGVDEWSGIFFELLDTNLRIWYGGVTETIVTPDVIGKTTFASTPFTLWVSTEIKDLDNGGTPNDVLYTIYLNGKLYTTLFAMNEASNLTNVLGIGNGSGAISAVPKTTKSINAPKELKEISFRDFDVKSGAYEDSTTLREYADEYSLSELLATTILSGNVEFSSTASAPQVEPVKQATLSYLNGLIRISNYHTYYALPAGNLCLCIMDKYVLLNPEIAGTELLDKEFKLSIAVLEADFDGDGVSTDALVGIYINDKLYNNTFFRAKGLFDTTGITANLSINATGSALYVSSVGEGEEPTVVLEELPTDLPIVTYTNWNIPDLKDDYWITKVRPGSVMDQIFTGYLTVNGVVYVQYGGKGLDESNDYWYGIRLRFDGSKVTLTSSSGEFTNSYDISPKTAGTELYNNRFLLQLSTRKVDSDKDGLEDDVQLGIWFNGVLYDNTYFYLVDAVDKLGNNIAVMQPYRDTEQGFFSIESVKLKVDLSEYGFDENWAKSLGLVK